MFRKKHLAMLGAVALAAAAVPLLVTTFSANAESAVQWTPCADMPGIECATVSVPMDYSKPDGEKITIAISRVPATDKSRRRGVLFTNPGGPGGEGRTMVGNYPGQPIGQVYDLIGMDPRGTGESTPLNCVIPGSADSLPQPAVDSRPTDAEFPLVANVQQMLEKACVDGGGEYRKHVNTANTARDMDTIRALLGEEKINYLGVSYGTWLGAVYGEMFPERLDRSVLDSSLDPNTTWHDQNYDVVKSIKFNFDSWATWIADRDKVFHLGAHPWAVRSSIDRIAAAIAKKPMAGFKDLATFDAAVGESTRYRLMWAPFAKNMQKTLAEIGGKQADPTLAASNQRTADATSRMVAEDTKINGVFQTVTCEWAWPTDLNIYYRDMRAARDHFPYGGTVSALSPTNCAFQTGPHEPLVKIGPRHYPAGLVLAADGDTQTAYPNGQAMARTLGNTLISVRDNGAHGQYATGTEDQNGPIKPNTCVDEKVNAYLVDGKMPPPRSSCDTANPPAAIPADPHGVDIDALIPDLDGIAQAILDSLLPPHER